MWKMCHLNTQRTQHTAHTLKNDSILFGSSIKHSKSVWSLPVP